MADETQKITPENIENETFEEKYSKEIELTKTNLSGFSNFLQEPRSVVERARFGVVPKEDVPSLLQELDAQRDKIQDFWNKKSSYFTSNLKQNGPLDKLCKQRLEDLRSNGTTEELLEVAETLRSLTAGFQNAVSSYEDLVADMNAAIRDLEEESIDMPEVLGRLDNERQARVIHQQGQMIEKLQKQLDELRSGGVNVEAQAGIEPTGDESVDDKPVDNKAVDLDLGLDDDEGGNVIETDEEKFQKLEDAIGLDEMISRFEDFMRVANSVWNNAEGIDLNSSGVLRLIASQLENPRQGLSDLLEEMYNKMDEVELQIGDTILSERVIELLDRFKLFYQHVAENFDDIQVDIAWCEEKIAEHDVPSESSEDRTEQKKETGRNPEIELEINQLFESAAGMTFDDIYRTAQNALAETNFGKCSKDELFALTVFAHVADYLWGGFSTNNVSVDDAYWYILGRFSEEERGEIRMAANRIAKVLDDPNNHEIMEYFLEKGVKSENVKNVFTKIKLLKYNSRGQQIETPDFKATRDVDASATEPFRPISRRRGADREDPYDADEVKLPEEASDTKIKSEVLDMVGPKGALGSILYWGRKPIIRRLSRITEGKEKKDEYRGIGRLLKGLGLESIRSERKLRETIEKWSRGDGLSDAEKGDMCVIAQLVQRAHRANGENFWTRSEFRNNPIKDEINLKIEDMFSDDELERKKFFEALNLKQEDIYKYFSANDVFAKMFELNTVDGGLSTIIGEKLSGAGDFSKKLQALYEKLEIKNIHDLESLAGIGIPSLAREGSFRLDDIVFANNAIKNKKDWDELSKAQKKGVAKLILARLLQGGKDVEFLDKVLNLWKSGEDNDGVSEQGMDDARPEVAADEYEELLGIFY